jgi:hypothetical protein
VEPNPEPVIVTCVPGAPLVGETPEIVAVFTVNVTEFDHAPLCFTRAVPEMALAATVATTCVSLQLTTGAYVLPSHTPPLPCVEPNPEPEIVICPPGALVVGETLDIAGRGATLKVAALLVPADVVTVTLAVPTLTIKLAGTLAASCVALM